VSLPWPKHVAVFRECQILVGVHAAGTQNLMVRSESPMTVVDLSPCGFFPPHYYWMAELLGYRCLPRSDRGDGQFVIKDGKATVRTLTSRDGSLRLRAAFGSSPRLLLWRR